MKLPALRTWAAAALAALTFQADAVESAKPDGRAIYNYRCYFCHGYSGDAKTLAATYLTPPPASFKAAEREKYPPSRVIEALRHGRPGTAMKSFQGILSDAEIEAVAHFVVDEFVVRKAENTRYHTRENGWPEHDRYAQAFPFARGEIPLSQPWESLSPEQTAGKRLYLASCVTCHDRGAPGVDEVTWDSRAVSYPRNNFSYTAPPVDAMSSASPFALHDIPPKLTKASAVEKKGERLFQKNCAFCHGADGSGQNWIGKFMEPHPRNLRDPAFMNFATRESIAHAIREGLPNTSMPAWKSVLSEGEIQAVVAYINRAFHPLRKATGAK